MKTIDFEDFVDTVLSEVVDCENNIKGNISYQVLYRLKKKYGFSELRIRGSFEDIEEIEMLSDYSYNYSFKDFLFSFGILFSEGTTENTTSYNSNRRELIILDEWTTFIEYQNLVNTKLEYNELSGRPTDIMIEKEMSNREAQNVNIALQKNGHSNVTVWFVQKDKDIYTSADEKEETITSKFNTDEIEDVFPRIAELLESNNRDTSIVDELIDYGSELYRDGKKCLVYDGEVIASMQDSYFFDLISAFLVYMSETYGMTISTVHDSIFSKMYRRFCTFKFASANDVLDRKYRYFPMMYHVKGSSRNLLFVRDIVQEYESGFVPIEDIDKMIIGDTSVKMSEWATSTIHLFNNSGYIRPYMKDGSINPDLLRTTLIGDTATKQSYYDVPIRDVIDDEDKIISIVHAFNEYNLRSGMHSAKFITTRDLVCRVKINDDDDDETYFIGYISNNRDLISGGRVVEKAIISAIDSKKPFVSGTFFSLGDCPLCNLYSLNYIYDFVTEAPRGISNMAFDTKSYQNFDDSYSIDEDDIFGSVERKFLYYVFTNYTYLSGRVVSNVIESLVGEKIIYRDACYNAVTSSTDLINNLKGKFQLRNLIEADLLTPYGEINRKFIGYTSEKSYFSIKSELFGKIKLG